MLKRLSLASAIGALLLSSTSFATASSLSDPFGVLTAVPTASCAQVDASKPISLADAVMMSLCKDPSLAAALYGERAAEGSVGVARSAYLPTVSLNSDAGRAFTRESGLSSSSGNASDMAATLSYVLFDFGKRHAANQEALANLSVQRYARTDTYQQVILNTASSYITLNSLNLQLKAAQDAQQAASEALQVANEKYKVGVAARSDMLQAKTVFAQNRLAVVQADSAVKNAEAALKLQLGVPFGESLQLQEADVKGAAQLDLQPLDGLLTQAADARPDILEARSQVEANVARITETRAQYLPTLSVSAQSGLTNTPGVPHTGTSNAMLSLRIPLFSGFEGKYATASAEATRDQSESQLKSVQRAAALDVFTQRQELSSAKASLEAANAFTESARETVQVALKQYKEGVGTMYDLLNAQAQLAQAHEQTAQAYASLETSRLALARSLGQLSLESL